MRFLTILSALLLPCAFILTSCNQTAFTKQINDADKLANLANTQIAPSIQEEAKRISVEDAKVAYDKGGVVIVDTRDSDSFAQEHIKGAINIPLPEFEKRYQEIPSGKLIVAYCS